MQNFNEKHPHVIEKRGMQMQNLRRKYPHLIKRQDVDAIYMYKWGEKYLQVQRKASCRYISLKKSICNGEYQGIADTAAFKRASAQANKPRI